MKFYRMVAHQLQTAKQRFSAVAESAAGGVPQLVTKHGRPFVIIVSAAEWQRTHGPRKSIIDVLKACPEDLSDLQISRSKDLSRKVSL